MGSITQGADGKWHAYVDFGVDDAGRRRRKHIQRTNRDELIELFEVALAESHHPGDSAAATSHKPLGSRRKAPETVGDWFIEWLYGPVALERKPTTWTNYEGFIRRNILPVIGDRPLTTLTESDIRSVLTRIPSRSVQEQALKVMKAGIAVAWQHRRVLDDVAKRVRLPRRRPVVVDEDDELTDAELTDAWTVSPDRVLTVDELSRVFKAIRTSRNEARWLIGIALGLRQSECLGLCWSDVDWENRTLNVRRNYLRRTYKHGCADPKTCPKTPGRCPNRVRQGQVDTTKTPTSKRLLPLSDALVAALSEHRARQDAERRAAGKPWPRRDWIFRDQGGQPLQHAADQKAWKRILRTADVQASYRLHDLRHTAATRVGALGADSKTMQAIFGWSTPRMANVYQHAVDARIRTALERQWGDE